MCSSDLSTVEERKKMQEYKYKVVVQAALGAANEHKSAGVDTSHKSLGAWPTACTARSGSTWPRPSGCATR